MKELSINYNPQACAYYENGRAHALKSFADARGDFLKIEIVTDGVNARIWGQVIFGEDRLILRKDYTLAKRITSWNKSALVRLAGDLMCAILRPVDESSPYRMGVLMAEMVRVLQERAPKLTAATLGVELHEFKHDNYPFS